MRLIDADYLLDQIDDAETVTKDGIAYCVDCSVEEDAVIVVRCKDCKHYLKDSLPIKTNEGGTRRMDVCNKGFCCDMPEFFCGYGERRTE